MNVNARKIAYELLLDWEQNRTFPNLALKNALRTVDDHRDRRFITALVYGVVERKITLDHFIDQCLDKKQIQLPIRTLLRIGLYQMFYMNIPDSAACNTTVDLAKKQGLVRLAAFVNAVLRRCAREKDEMLLLKKTDFSVRYSISPFLVDLLLEQYGKETFVAMMEGLNKPQTKMYLFHHFKKCSEEEFLKRLGEDRIFVEPTASSHLFCSAVGFSPEHSKAFADGLYHIVGPHSAEAALLIPQGANKVMDLCAAPGGKTFILSAMTQGTVWAYDIHSHKIDLLKKEATRLGVTNVCFSQHDGTELINEMKNSADFVLCDVPCSGLGMMNKKPDVKYKNYKSEDFTSTQYIILQNGASYLKSGGRLVYSTCTIDRRENEHIIERFLNENHNFEIDKDALMNGEQLSLPLNGEDGFYIAVLKRIK